MKPVAARAGGGHLANFASDAAMALLAGGDVGNQQVVGTFAGGCAVTVGAGAGLVFAVTEARQWIPAVLNSNRCNGPRHRFVRRGVAINFVARNADTLLNGLFRNEGGSALCGLQCVDALTFSKHFSGNNSQQV